MALTQTPEEGLKVSNAPSDGKFLQYKDSTDKLTWATAADGTMSNLVEDTTPQLGGDLDIQARKITTSTTNGNVAIEPNGSGKTIVGTGSAMAVIEGNDSANQSIYLQSSHAKVFVGSGANGSVQLHADGTGTVDLVSDSRKTKLGLGTSEETLTTHMSGAHIKIEPAGTSGNITVKSGANEDIELSPNGTGSVKIDGLNYPQSDGSAGQFLKTDGSAQLSWATVSTSVTTTSGTDNFTVADGNLVIATSGHGIDFSAGTNNAGTTSELLDDYEEGVFTVTSGTTNQTFHSNSDLLTYIKIGSFVFFGGQIRVDDAGDSSHVQLHINNLPFQNDGGGEGSADGRCAFSTGGMTKDDYNGGANYYDTTWWRNISIGGTTLLNYRSIDTNNKWFYGYVIDDAYVSVTGSYRTDD